MLLLRRLHVDVGRHAGILHLHGPEAGVLYGRPLILSLVGLVHFGLCLNLLARWQASDPTWSEPQAPCVIPATRVR